MELAVLSACETGLGEAAAGEGVFGLQRAFHLAGCRNVIASLWKVDDEATAALMKLFYHHLWVQKQPPLEALRQGAAVPVPPPRAAARAGPGPRPGTGRDGTAAGRPVPEGQADADRAVGGVRPLRRRPLRRQVLRGPPFAEQGSGLQRMVP